VAQKRGIAGFVATLAGLALVTTGCSAHPGAAARIGDHNISEETVTEVATALPDVLAQRVSREDALRLLTSSYFQNRMGHDKDVTFTDDQVLDLMKQVAASRGLEAPENVPASVLDVFRGEMVLQQLQVDGNDLQTIQQELEQYYTKEKIDINPRYYTAQANTKQASTLADIVTPADVKAPKSDGDASTDTDSQSGHTH